MRKLNPVFLLGLVVALLALSGATYLVHGHQVQRNAAVLLDRARKDEEQGKTSQAAKVLWLYLGLEPHDKEAWRSYARVLDGAAKNGRSLEQVFLVNQEALRYNPGDPALERRCLDLALKLGRTADARRHLDVLLTRAADKLDKNAEVSSAALELAELKELEGRCLELEAQFTAAANAYSEAISYDPSRLFSYLRLAGLDRNQLRKASQDADGEIEWMVANNPASGLAHLYRFRYLGEFRPPAPDGDLKKALELSPDNPEILLTASLAAQQKKDPAAARTYLEKGLKLNPQNAAFPIALAWLERGEGHVDRAESVLRQADQANPSPDMAFELAEILIAQNKIDAQDQAAGYIARLRDAGYGDTLVRYLEARILHQNKQWAEAIPRLETARALFKSDPQLAPLSERLNLMLADCYSHRTNSDEQRMDALRQAAESDRATEFAHIEYAQALARSGKLDEAIAALTPLVASKPEVQLDLVRLLIHKASRPENQRNWQEVERSLAAAEKALPQAVEPLTFLRVDMLVARKHPGDLEKAHGLLKSAQAKDPRNLPYRLARARLTVGQGKGPEALQILDQAEKDLGPSPRIQLARLDCWGQQGGEAAKAAVARLAATRQQIPAADRPAFLDRLALTEIRLREPALASQHWRELASLQPENLPVRLALFNLALEARDQNTAAELLKEITRIDGAKGTFRGFARATLLIDKARREGSHNPEEARDLEEVRGLAAEISEARPDWWAGPTLNGELAELVGSLDLAIGHYLRAIELGNVQPSFTRRLVGLLNQRNRFNDINHVVQVLGEQGVNLDDLFKAIDAIRKQDFDRGIKLARQAFPENSTSPSDHITLGRFYAVAGQSDEAGEEFRQAVERGPGLPESWLTYVQFLVQAKQLDQARTAIEAARQKLPADRAALALAQCWMFLGDLKQADELIAKALTDPGTSADPDALKIATVVALGQNHLDKPEEYLKKLDRVTNLSPGDKAWGNRIRASLLLSKGRPTDQDQYQALVLIDRNLMNDPRSIEDLRLKASILALQPKGGRDRAVEILKQLDDANQIDAREQFLLARLYLGQGAEPKYQDEMLKVLKLKTRDPQHLAHFVNYWISRKQPDQAGRWLVELKKAEPRGVAALELEARLLDLRKDKTQLLALLEARGKDVPDQIGLVADLLNRFGFAKQAETAYKAFIARDPKQPVRVLALAQFLAGKDRVAEAMEILKKAWSTCRPDLVALAALKVYEAPSTDETQRAQIKAWLKEAIQKGPEVDRLEPKLATILYLEGRFDEAEAIYRKVLDRHPADAESLNDLAWELAMRDPSKGEEALGLINRAIELHGNVPNLVNTRGVVLIRANRLDRALEDLRVAKAGDPANPNYAFYLAWALLDGGHTEEARKEFREAERLGLKAIASDPLSRGVLDRLRSTLTSN